VDAPGGEYDAYSQPATLQDCREPAGADSNRISWRIMCPL